MIDAQGIIADLISGAGVSAWRNRLPAGHENTAPAVQIETDDDNHHQTGATRLVRFTLRVYGGSMRLQDVRSTVNAVYGALLEHNSPEVARIGAITISEPPPEPDTGWPSAVMRFEARVKEN